MSYVPTSKKNTQVKTFQKKPRTKLLYDPAILLLNIYLKDPKTLFQRTFVFFHVYCGAIQNNQVMETTQISKNI